MAGKQKFGGHCGGVQARVLTETDIVKAAVKVARQTGFDRLTVKAVAEQLGITSPALYYHVSGRRDLLDRAASHVIEAEFAGELTTRPNEEWIDALTRELSRVVSLSAGYPGVFAYVLRQPARVREPRCEQLRRIAVEESWFHVGTRRARLHRDRGVDHWLLAIDSDADTTGSASVR